MWRYQSWEKPLSDAGQRRVGIGAGGQDAQCKAEELLLIGPEEGERSGWNWMFQLLFGFLVSEPHTSPGTFLGLAAPSVDSGGKPLSIS